MRFKLSYQINSMKKVIKTMEKNGKDASYEKGLVKEWEKVYNKEKKDGQPKMPE